jgi:hypothetical protein
MRANPDAPAPLLTRWGSNDLYKIHQPREAGPSYSTAKDAKDAKTM